MRIPRIYQNIPLLPQQEYILDEEASRHLHLVLRLEEKHKLILFNGDGFEYLAHILKKNSKRLPVYIEEKIEKNKESSLKIHLGQVISKGEKMDLTLQKATELGVTAITPLLSNRCEVRLNSERQDKKIQHWQKVIISSCEQCGRNILPILHPITSLYTWLNTLNTPTKQSNQTKILLDPHSKLHFQDLNLSNDIVLLIGPEGGLDPEENQTAKSQAFQGLQLGPRILRTETAGLAIISVLQALKGDFR